MVLFTTSAELSHRDSENQMQSCVVPGVHISRIWTYLSTQVVFKALIVLHTMIRNGATDNVLTYLSSEDVLKLRNVSNSQWEGMYCEPCVTRSELIREQVTVHPRTSRTMLSILTFGYAYIKT